MSDVDNPEKEITQIVPLLDTEQWIALGCTGLFTLCLLFGLLVLTLHILFPTKNMIRWAAQRFPDVVFFRDNPAGLVALTIDDAPHPKLTPDILDVLDRHNCRASFFCIGDYCEANPSLVQEMSDRGHELCNHMKQDMPTIKLEPTEFTRQLLHVENILRPYRKPDQFKWFRPGGGFFNKKMIDLARASGYITVLGSVYAHDPFIKLPFVISRYMKKKTESGDIIVLHDGSEDRRQTVLILNDLLPHLKSQGFQVVTLSELAAASGNIPDGESILSGSSASKVAPQPWTTKSREQPLNPKEYALMEEIPID